MTIKNDDKVSLDYEGKLENGEVFDSSRHGDHSHPLEFTVGKQMVVPGFEKAVIGMEVGEEKEFTIEPKEAYGQYDPALIREFPRDMINASEELKPGMILMLQAPEGQFPATVAKIDEDKIILDLNHFLAGKKLIFKIKIISIN